MIEDLKGDLVIVKAFNNTENINLEDFILAKKSLNNIKKIGKEFLEMELSLSVKNINNFKIELEAIKKCLQ